MAQAEATSRRADSLGDIDDWMLRRRADLKRLGSEAEAAGREAWGWATRSGQDVAAARPRDVALLGERFRRGQATPTQTTRVSLTEPEPLQKIEDAVEPGEGPDFAAPQPMDLGLRFQAARSGDSISRLLGSSDPRAIGKFLSLNGMDGRSSTLREGRSYVVPSRWDDATSGEAQAGRKLLGADSARLQPRAEQEAEVARRAELLNQGRNIWNGEPVEARPPTRPLQTLKPRRNSLDDSPTTKAVVGTMGWGLGLAPGVVRGGLNTLKGAVEGADFVRRLTSPYDAILSPPGQSASEQLLDAGLRFGSYVKRGVEDPSIVRDDIGSALHDFRLKQDPFATPVADTLGGEFHRTFDIGMNNGELAFDAGSLFLGGEFLRGAAGLGRAAKAADATELAFLTKNPGLAARFDELYKGMGHHIVERSAKLPPFLGGGSYPKWFIENKLNKIREEGISTRDFYRNHNGAAGHFHGSKIPAAYGGGSWRAKDLGWTRYGPLDQLNYGTSPYTKAVVGPTLLGGTLTDWIDEEDR